MFQYSKPLMRNEFGERGWPSRVIDFLRRNRVEMIAGSVGVVVALALLGIQEQEATPKPPCYFSTDIDPTATTVVKVSGDDQLESATHQISGNTPACENEAHAVIWHLNTIIDDPDYKGPQPGDDEAIIPVSQLSPPYNTPDPLNHLTTNS